MLYAILAYHEEEIVASWSPDEDAALMTDLLNLHDKLYASKTLGPAARLGPTGRASTLRRGVVTDGPFAETKEHLLGLYVVDCATHEEAVEAARKLHEINRTAVYEIREILLYLPGTPFPVTEAAQEGADA